MFLLGTENVVKLKNCQIGKKIGVVVDIDPMIMIVVTKRQKDKKDKNTKIQKKILKRQKIQKRQKAKKTKKIKRQKRLKKTIILKSQ